MRSLSFQRKKKKTMMTTKSPNEKKHNGHWVIPHIITLKWCGVTKKEGSIERTAHLLWSTNHVDLTLLIFSTHVEFQSLSHSNYWPALFAHTSQIKDVQTQQHDRPQVSFFSLAVHTCIRQRNFPLHSQHMYNLESTSFLDIRRLTKQQLQPKSALKRK